MIHQSQQYRQRLFDSKFFLPTLLAVVVFCLFYAKVQARTIDDVQDEINQVQEDQSSNSTQSKSLSKKAGTIQDQIDNLAQQIASIQSQIDTNTARQTELSNKIEVQQKKLEEQKELLSANIRSMYIEGDISPLEMIASSKNLGDFVDKQEYRDRIKDNISDAMDEIENLKKQLDSQKQEVTAIISEQKTLRGTLNVKNQEANTKLAKVKQSKASFDNKIASQTKEIAKLQQEVEQMQAALATVTPQTIQNIPNTGGITAGTVIGTVGNTGNSFGSHLHLRAQRNGVAINPAQFLGSRWQTPVSAPITQWFGENPYMYGYGAAGHDGIDYGAPTGTPIRAVEGGTLYKGWSQNLVGFWHFGCMAMIQHSDGLISIYAHMEASNC